MLLRQMGRQVSSVESISQVYYFGRGLFISLESQRALWEGLFPIDWILLIGCSSNLSPTKMFLGKQIGVESHLHRERIDRWFSGISDLVFSKDIHKKCCMSLYFLAFL